MSFLTSLWDHVSLYYDIIVFFIYFCVGALTIFIVKIFLRLIFNIFNILEKNNIKIITKKLIKLCCFIILSILLGYLIFKFI